MCWHIRDCVQKLPVWKVVINCQILNCTAIHWIALHDFALQLSLNNALFSVHWSMLNIGQFWRWWLCLHFNFQFCFAVWCKPTFWHCAFGTALCSVHCSSHCSTVCTGHCSRVGRVQACDCGEKTCLNCNFKFCIAEGGASQLFCTGHLALHCALVTAQELAVCKVVIVGERQTSGWPG